MIVKRMNNTAIDRIGEIDRSEHVTLGYVYENGALKAEAVDWQISRWTNDDSAFSVNARISEWSALLDQGSVLFGAFDTETLVGFAILRPRLTETMAQLAVLHVSRNHRRQGVASLLMNRVCALARETGATHLYVSATPSESAVKFYQSQGFELARKVNPELYALEPEDIHMIRAL